MKKTIFTSILLGGLISLAFVIPALAASTVSLSPSSINKIERQSFSVLIKINPQSVKNYTSKIKLEYPANLLKVSSFTFGNNWMRVNQPKYDSIDNINGILIKTAGYPGGISLPKTFGTVLFYAKKAGSGVIKIANGSFVLGSANQNLLTKIASQTSFTISAPVIVSKIKGGSIKKVSVATTLQHKKEPIKKILTTTSAKKAKGIITQQHLLGSLATIWGGNNQTSILIAVIIILVLALVYFASKEWKLFQRRRKK